VLDPASRAVRSRASIADGRWHYIAASYGATGYKVYIDGRLSASAPNDGPLSYFQNEVAVGRDGHACDGVVPSFRGDIANVAVYPRALSVARLASHMLAARIPAG
jgi:hypothetical protein